MPAQHVYRTRRREAEERRALSVRAASLASALCALAVFALRSSSGSGSHWWAGPLVTLSEPVDDDLPQAVLGEQSTLLGDWISSGSTSEHTEHWADTSHLRDLSREAESAELCAPQQSTPMQMGNPARPFSELIPEDAAGPPEAPSVEPSAPGSNLTAGSPEGLTGPCVCGAAECDAFCASVDERASRAEARARRLSARLLGAHARTSKLVDRLMATDHEPTASPAAAAEHAPPPSGGWWGWALSVLVGIGLGYTCGARTREPAPSSFETDAHPASAYPRHSYEPYEPDEDERSAAHTPTPIVLRSPRRDERPGAPDAAAHTPTTPADAGAVRPRAACTSAEAPVAACSPPRAVASAPAHTATPSTPPRAAGAAARQSMLDTPTPPTPPDGAPPSAPHGARLDGGSAHTTPTRPAAEHTAEEAPAASPRVRRVPALVAVSLPTVEIGGAPHRAPKPSGAQPAARLRLRLLTPALLALGTGALLLWAFCLLAPVLQLSRGAAELGARAVGEEALELRRDREHLLEIAAGLSSASREAASWREERAREQPSERVGSKPRRAPMRRDAQLGTHPTVVQALDKLAPQPVHAQGWRAWGTMWLKVATDSLSRRTQQGASVLSGSADSLRRAQTLAHQALSTTGGAVAQVGRGVAAASAQTASRATDAVSSGKARLQHFVERARSQTRRARAALAGGTARLQRLGKRARGRASSGKERLQRLVARARTPTATSWQPPPDPASASMSFEAGSADDCQSMPTAASMITCMQMASSDGWDDANDGDGREADPTASLP